MGDTSKSPLEVPFLDVGKQDGNHDDYEAARTLQHRGESWFKRHGKALAVHGFIIALYAYLAAVMFGGGKTHCRAKPLLFSPAQDYIRHTVQVIPDHPRHVRSSKYVGRPSPEVDAAWHRLLRHHNIRITDAEFEAMNLTSVPLRHGGGGQAMMAVFHELHCVKHVREAIHPEYYYKNKGELELSIIRGHTEHCIDVLRAGAMCRADTAIFPYHWTDKTRLPSPTWVQRHECVDWDRLGEFLDERGVDIHAPNMLVHPKYGPVYPGGKQLSEPHGPKVYPLDAEP